MTTGNSTAGDGPRNDGGVQPRPRFTPPIPPSDAAVQVVESAFQILTMIGANPRAIRPLLAQRRLAKEAVLEAADSLSERVALMLDQLESRAAAEPAAGTGTADGAGKAATAGQSATEVERRFLTSLRDHAVRVREVYATL